MRAFPVLALTGACALAGFAWAQPQQTPPPSQPSTVFRSSATEVLLDVVVLDKHGKPVKNLKASDLQVFEDEVKQDITSFRSCASRRNSCAARTIGTAKYSAAAAPVAPSSSHALHAVNLICIVFHNLDPESRLKAIEVVQQFLKNDLPPEYVYRPVRSGRPSESSPSVYRRQAGDRHRHGECADVAAAGFYSTRPPPPLLPRAPP